MHGWPWELPRSGVKVVAVVMAVMMTVATCTEVALLPITSSGMCVFGLRVASLAGEFRVEGLG